MDPDETLGLPPPHLLFASVTYHIAPSFPPNRIEELDAVLQEYGGNRAEGGLKDEKLTTVIANSARWEGWEEVGEDSGIDVVTDKWVERSVVLGKLQLAQHFSTNPALLFSGVVACSTSDLPPTDLEVLSAGIIALGGQWRTGLTKDVTHLFAMTPDSSKYATAMHYQETTRIKVVLPHWFDDTIRLGTGKLSTEPYEWPEVKMLKGVEGLTGGPEENKIKRNMYATAAIFTPGMAQTTPPLQQDIDFVNAATAEQLASSPVNGINQSAVALHPGAGVWGGRKIILSRTLQLYRGRREAVQAGIERAGGVVLRFEGDEEEEEPPIEFPPEKGKEKEGPRYKLHMNERTRRRNEAQRVSECDVLVTRWRFGRAYVLAVRSVKTIGTLAWLFHVQSTGVLSRPLDQLLHYPVPKRIIEGFHNHVITVTNYTGEAREYLKKLISAMGATFTPSMSGQNTALIAAYTSGTKATKARSWSIPVVNHTWIEDCFVQWRNLTPALEKYIVFPDGVDFATMLGERGVFVGPVGGGKKAKISNEDGDRFEISKGRIELEAEELFTDGEVEVASDAEGDGDVQMAPPPASEGMVNGVEEAEVLEELGMDVDVGVVEESSAPAKPATTPAKRASPTKAGVKSQSTPLSKAKATPKSKPTPKSTKLAEDVIELESSSSEGDAKIAEVKVNGKGKGKGKAKVVEEEDEEEEQDEAPPAKKPRPKPKPITKPAKSKPKHASESDEDGDQDERPSKTPKSKVKVPKRLTISSVESDEESLAEPQDEEEPPKKGSSKKLKRRFSAASVPDDDDEGEDEVEEEVPKTKSKSKTTAKPTKSTKRQSIPPPASSSSDEEEPMFMVSKPKPKLTKSSSPLKPPSAPAKSTPKTTKPTKRQPVPSESEEESVVVISKTKANAKPKVSSSSKLASGSANAAADAAAMPSAGGLLNRVRGDARTRVKKRVPRGDEEKAKAKVVESEDEEENEEDEAPKGKAKANVNGKAKAKDARGKKGKKAATPSESEAEDEGEGEGGGEEEEEEESEPPKPTRVSSSKSKPGMASTSKAKAKAATTTTRKKPLRVYSENDENGSDNSDSKAERNTDDEAEEVDEGLPSPRRLAFSKTATKSSSTKKAATAQTTSTTKPNPKSKSKVAELPPTKSKSKSKPTKTAPEESESGTEPDAPPPPNKKSTKVKDGKNKATAQVGSPSTPRRVMSVLVPTLSISGGRLLGVDRGEDKTKGKGKKRAVAEKENDEEEDGEEEEEEVTLKGKGKAKAKAHVEPVKKNKASVKEKPSKPASTIKVDSKSKSKRPRESSDEEEEEEEEVNAIVSPRTRAMARTDSLHVVSAQANIPISSTSAAGKSTSKAKTKTKATPKTAQEKEKEVKHRYRQRLPSPSSLERDTPMDVDSHPVSGSIAASTSSGPSASLPRRSAAAKATQKLRDSIMPDVMQYEAQVKRSRSTKGRGSAAAFVVDGDGGREKKDKEKEKRKLDEDGDERSKKKRRVSFSEDVEEPAEVEASKAKSSKTKQRAGVPMDVDKDHSNSSTDVRVMTTQVSLADDVSKALSKMGVTFTTRPSECTHLLAHGVVRTEKFLCALAMKSFILSEKWAIASADAKRLLPEKDFPLKDNAGERKYNVDLAKALRLAQKNDGKLLHGHTFYVTPRVNIDTKLLKNVVNACGGQVTTQSPTLRIINASPETRHVISCKEDISIWRPLAAHGIKVYSQELVLEGALRQEMDWDKESFLVKV